MFLQLDFYKRYHSLLNCFYESFTTLLSSSRYDGYGQLSTMQLLKLPKLRKMLFFFEERDDARITSTNLFKLTNAKAQVSTFATIHEDSDVNVNTLDFIIPVHRNWAATNAGCLVSTYPSREGAFHSLRRKEHQIRRSESFCLGSMSLSDVSYSWVF